MKEPTVIMPLALTAENGAKALMIGEFNETAEFPCFECEECGAEDDCPECDGTGQVMQVVPVTWTTIKEIYAMAISKLSRPSSPIKTYVIDNADRLDRVTVYVMDSGSGRGKITIDCFGKAWTATWPAMDDNTSLQEFFLSADNAYILGKMLQETTQTDFDAINDIARTKGFDSFGVTSDVEIAMCPKEMEEIIGPDWYMELPTCSTPEYSYLSRILNAVKAEFRKEAEA